MKRKLKTLFFLITIALTGIIALQIFWSVNAYNVTKTRFDADVDIAMQNAMNDCKKDYFDSIRVVLIRRLSDTVIKIHIDTLREADTVHKQLSVYMKSKYGSLIEPFHITSNQFDYYRAMIKHKPATIPEVLTETSFYMPVLMNDWQMLLGMDDIREHWAETAAYLKAHSNIPSDTIFARQMNKQYGIYALPPNYEQADSIKLRHYLTLELGKRHIIKPNFDFHFSVNHTQPRKLTSTYSETGEYTYKYHGFVFLGVTGRPFFARATFSRAQFSVLYKILAPLLLTLLLLLFTIYCFSYIIRLVIHQRKLAELKDDFINNMTHELKTPIATIAVAIEGLQNFNALNDKEKTQRYLQTSRIELLKLNNLVTKVLNIAAFENKDVDLVKETINVDEMVNEIISGNKIKADKKTEITYRNENVKNIFADRTHFGNVLNNIIDNAIKYSKETADVDIVVTREGNNAVFTVKDKGIGIPSEHLKLVFDKFHRVPTGNVHNVKGTGLGLSYAQYIVNAHGGNISVKSEINEGSEFIVSIPLNNG
ncbi:MAG: sensor histidine kinase [Mucilaginibacter sp.]